MKEKLENKWKFTKTLIRKKYNTPPKKLNIKEREIKK